MARARPAAQLDLSGRPTAIAWRREVGSDGRARWVCNRCARVYDRPGDPARRCGKCLAAERASTEEKQPPLSVPVMLVERGSTHEVQPTSTKTPAIPGPSLSTPTLFRRDGQTIEWCNRCQAEVFPVFVDAERSAVVLIDANRVADGTIVLHHRWAGQYPVREALDDAGLVWARREHEHRRVDLGHKDGPHRLYVDHVCKRRTR